MSNITVKSPATAIVNSIQVSVGDAITQGQLLAVIESMKVQIQIAAPCAGVVDQLSIAIGAEIQKSQPICRIASQTTGTIHAKAIGASSVDVSASSQEAEQHAENDNLRQLSKRLASTLDFGRESLISQRHAKGFRSARENLADLCDKDSFVEYGQLAVAAQRGRHDFEELKTKAAADGIITGIATVNANQFPGKQSKTVVIVNDYTVLAGTQGYFHHQKLDRAIEQAREQKLPVIMYTEGGGGRPGDTDVAVQIAGLNITSFSAWAGLSGVVPRIAVNNGYCFAGNAALFGNADITIATRQSWIGMAGPVMIEGGGLGKHSPKEIGPIEVQSANAVIDLLADDEAAATALTKKVLSYFQGSLSHWSCADQSKLWSMMPADRRHAYDVRNIIQALADQDSFVELQPNFGSAAVVGLLRIEGKPFGLISNDCQVSGGAIDADAATKLAQLLTLCGNYHLPVISLCDTPGFMVGPESETEGAVRKMSNLFVIGAKLSSPMVTIFLRKAYGLGAMAMAGGSFVKPLFAAAWPSGEFGGMGLEGAVRLGFKKELDAAVDEQARQQLFDELVAKSYEQGKATEAASFLEIDAVIDPAETRSMIMRVMG